MSDKPQIAAKFNAFAYPDGRIQVFREDEMKKWAAENLAGSDGREIVVIVAEKQAVSPRMKAYRYYRGVALPVISRALGIPQKELHERFKAMFLPAEKESTTQLTRREFSDFVEEVCALAAGIGIVIPPSNNFAEVKETPLSHFPWPPGPRGKREPRE